ncbi:MAG: 50S ribosomal protein L18 [Patescibacteria group bacterium]
MSKSVKINGTKDKPRVSVYRSNRFISGQVIDDVAGKTLFSVSSQIVKTGKPTEKAFEAGRILGAKITEKKIGSLVFDRNGYRYHGQVKAFADGIRDAGVTI